MMDIVVDASAVLAVLLHEPHRDAIIRATRGRSLASPDSLPFEVANALSARMKRQGSFKLTRKDAATAFAAFQAMAIALLPQTMADHANAVRLSGSLGIYAYDAYVLASAQSAKARLLSLDGLGSRPGLRQIAERLRIELVELEA